MSVKVNTAISVTAIDIGKNSTLLASMTEAQSFCGRSAPVAK